MIQFGVGFGDRGRAVPEDDPGQLDALCLADGGAGRVPKLVRVPLGYAGLAAGVLNGTAVTVTLVSARPRLRRRIRISCCPVAASPLHFATNSGEDRVW